MKASEECKYCDIGDNGDGEYIIENFDTTAHTEGVYISYSDYYGYTLKMNIGSCGSIEITACPVCARELKAGDGGRRPLAGEHLQKQ